MHTKKSFSWLPYCFLLISLLGSISLLAQDAALIIRGRVVDKKSRLPIQHVSVSEVDADNRTVRGIATDIDGNFALRISNPKDRISFSYIGYKSITQAIKAGGTLTIQLEQENANMGDVVIVSYKQTNNGNLNISDKNSTLATAKIDAKVMEEMSSASIDQALQGRISGVDITATSGDPGAGMSIRIRGTSSLNAGANPMIVVDGIPFETAIPSDFNFGTADEQGYAGLLNIAPSDIKDISVLKDAAATAMWGSRAANGVLIITTKRGSIGKPVLSYTLRANMSKQPKPIPLLNGDQYSNLIPEMVMNRTGAPLNTLTTKEFAYDPSDPYWYHNYSQNTNWLEAVTQTGFTHEHNLSMTGGGERASYYASLGYLNQRGTTIGTNFNRLTTRINLDYNVSERIKFKTDFSYTYSDNPRNYYPGAAAREIRNVALNKMPNMSIYEYNEQGIQTPNFFSPASNIQGQYPGTYNPVAMARSATNRIITNRVIPHFNLNYSIIPKVLSAIADVQFDINNTKNNSFLPQIATGRPTTETVVNQAYDGDIDGFNVQTKTNLVYTPKLGPDHSLISLLSFQTYDYKGISNQALTSNTASSLLQDPGIPSRTQDGGLNVGAGFTQTRSIGALINGNYGYKDKYFLSAAVRTDGSSRFGPSSRYGVFPSVSGAWIITEEKFMSGVKLINLLKLRGSWGLSGNEPNIDYAFYNRYGNFNNTYLGLGGVYPSTIQLEDLKWEKTNGRNIGIDLTMLDRKVSITLEMYRNRTSDLLFKDLQIPSHTGYTTVPIMNVGTIDNQGWEIDLKTSPVRTKTWTVDFNFNISHNENIFREISPFYAQQKGVTTSNGQYLAYLQIDNPFGSIYGYRFQGVYKDAASTYATDGKGQPIIGPNGQNVAMRFNYPNTDYKFQAGDARYEDINHDGNIDYKDVVYLGNSNPKLSGGFGPSITYKKNLKISAFFNFRSGYVVVNGTKMTTTNMYGFNNQSTAVLRRWRKEGDETDIPRAVWNAGFNWLGSDRYIEDASFLRFRTITARYTFKDKVVKKLKFKGLSTYVTAENLVTFTNYTGQDPEVAPRGVTGPFTIVTDNSTTPPTLTVTFGVVASF